MKWVLLLLLCIFTVCGIYYTTHFFVRYYSIKYNDHDFKDEEPMHILITVCNGGLAKEHESMMRYHEVVGLLITIQRYGMRYKDENIIVHIFTDDAVTLNDKFLKTLPTSKLIDFLDTRVYAIPDPKSQEHDYNKYLRCASTRLYAPHLFEVSIREGESIMDDIPERVLYLDTDTLVTTQLRELWDSSTAIFQEHPNALFAMSQECILVEQMGEYFHRGYAGENITDDNGTTHLVYTFPNGTCQGYNSGVLFAHLHRWRSTNFSDMVSEQESYAKRLNYKMLFGDQGILNAIGGRFPERLLELPCIWNMRIDTLNACFPHYVDNGGGILHMQSKNKGAFYFNKTLATTLHNYLIRVNDTVDFDLLSKYYDHENPDNAMFATILGGLLNGTTREDRA